MSCTIELKLHPFVAPDSVFVMLSPMPREYGLRRPPEFLLCEVSDEALEQLCKEFRAAVFAKKAAQLTRKDPDTSNGSVAQGTE